MVHRRAYLAAVGGKLLDSKTGRTTEIAAVARRLMFAAVALLVASVFGSASYAQSGPFAGLAGNWSGAGTVMLDDGSTERIRCRASYAISANGTGLNQTLVCASDSYKFDLRSNVTAEGQSLSGGLTESTRGVSGLLQGHVAGGIIQVIANIAGTTANITLTTRGNKQSVAIRSGGSFRAANVSLSRS
jgi:hypothetical protein